jgi:hypothetical protein
MGSFCTSGNPNSFKPEVKLSTGTLIGVYDNIPKYCSEIMFEDFRNQCTYSISKWKETKKKNIDSIYNELKDYYDNVDCNNINN